MDYEDQDAMLAIARKGLSKIPPETVLVNIGATASGIGAVYPLAKAMGFTTTGIVSSVAAEHMENISDAVDHVCFVADTQWGGKLAGSDRLSPTSQAMVACSDVLVAIGGGEVTRDALMAGRARGKQVYFYPAEVSHQYLIERARKRNEPPPHSFWGATHEIFGKRDGEFRLRRGKRSGSSPKRVRSVVVRIKANAPLRIRAWSAGPERRPRFQKACHRQ